MALNLNTVKSPGVYIDEISLLPSSVVAVDTAIPAFIGYTKMRKSKGVDFAVNVPKRITSFAEYIEMFGDAFVEELTVTIDDPEPGKLEPRISVAPKTTLSQYVMYYHVKMFYENGGGPCWIVSVENMATALTSAKPNKDQLKLGVNACEKIDEITLLVVPEAIYLNDGEMKELYDAMLAQCNKLQDRFSIFDVNESATTPFSSAQNFRNNNIGADYLKYGAAYYPQIVTSLEYNYLTDAVQISADNRGGTNKGIYIPNTTITPATYRTLINIIDGVVTRTLATGSITVANHTSLTGKAVAIGGKTYTFGSGTNDVATGISLAEAAINLKNKIAASSIVTVAINTSNSNQLDLTAIGNGTGAAPGTAGNKITLSAENKGGVTCITVSGTTLTGGYDSKDFALYNFIKSELKKYTVTLYPSGTVAGVYARVDRDRGVWKAPANVGLFTTIKPHITVSHEEQGSLNVDATTGKSINVIRKFTGKGNLVWGARTLAGNDNEWRYVPVRRLFIMIEESIKKATEFVVFEPNDANTWSRVKTMCENFLNSLWNQGALAGAKPNDAFYVNIGLGQTMTALDILEGRMNVEIGLAAVRPAEFIILKFSHLLAKS